jgi:amino acid transporter
MCLNLVLLLVSIAILCLNGGHFAQEVNFVSSPNPGYQSGLAMLSFVVFAIFAYGGIEAVGGLVDKTENPEKNFAKGIIFAAIVISIGYSLAIFLWGVSTNWQQVLSNNTTNLGNITYVLMKSLGMTLGKAMHLTPEASATMGIWFARITGLSMFLAYTGAFFTLIYSPLKAIIQGTPKALWPGRMTQLNTAGMPANAMWMQCLLVCVFILLVSFGGDTASAFYNKLTLMANVSMTLPYLFLTLAFPFFKAKQDLERPFVIFKTRAATLLATTVVVLVVAFANIFTIIQPVIEANDWNSALWMVGGRSSSRCWRWGFMRITVDARRRTSQKWRSGNIPSRKGGRALQAARRARTPPRSAFFPFSPSMLSRRIWNGGNGISIPCSRKPARISWWISWRSGIRCPISAA